MKESIEDSEIQIKEKAANPGDVHQIHKQIA